MDNKLDETQNTMANDARMQLTQELPIIEMEVDTGKTMESMEKENNTKISSIEITCDKLSNEGDVDKKELNLQSGIGFFMIFLTFFF
jgi:hypothetical protein